MDRVSTAVIFREVALVRAQELGSQQANLHVRRVVEGEGGPEIFVGYDAEGRRVLYVEMPLVPNCGVLWRSSGLIVEGHDTPALIVRHDSDRGEAQFALLCDQLREDLEGSPAESVESVVLTTIQEWATLFGREAHEISPEGVLGLLGELLTLRELVGALGASAALAMWTGPDRMRHDFVGSTGALEVKTLAAEDGLKVTFHGLRQLVEPKKGGLHLVVHQLERTPQGELTLSGVIADLPQVVRNDERLRLALAMAGCEPDAPEQADRLRFSHRSSRVLAVDAEFPRISPDTLSRPEWADSLMAVRYTVDVSAVPPVNTALENLIEAHDVD
ncbi:Putative PD-(D/E)XK family member [Kytococcus aerolatus]|uniref:Putative PD-(D/E)XK family member n=1 Tax=Kytococcus aerolatus TaxID=592308 RepID=A0A212T590_9MICO|nr:PD-(D/E)XK motif protein [Kytococcus aerolatus]SNC61179.1 Putative PD-(D/E)XK family member [Kytococcus aerolatus]